VTERESSAAARASPRAGGSRPPRAAGRAVPARGRGGTGDVRTRAPPDRSICGAWRSARPSARRCVTPRT
jgi:hypothetical protein